MVHLVCFVDAKYEYCAQFILGFSCFILHNSTCPLFVIPFVCKENIIFIPGFSSPCQLTLCTNQSASLTLSYVPPFPPCLPILYSPYSSCIACILSCLDRLCLVCQIITYFTHLENSLDGIPYFILLIGKSIISHSCTDLNINSINTNFITIKLGVPDTPNMMNSIFSRPPESTRLQHAT